MKKITKKLHQVSESSLFHDTRKDIRTLATAFNSLVDSINEIIDEVEKIKSNQNINPANKP